MSKIESIKNHVREHKKAYVVGASCFAVGLLGGVALVKSGDISIVVTGDKNQIVGKAKTVNQVMVELVERSTPSRPVHLVGTNLYFNSISEAARETGYARTLISQNINGHIPDVKGDVFKLLEPAA